MGFEPRGMKFAPAGIFAIGHESWGIDGDF
jgi:hypothetical protein